MLLERLSEAHGVSGREEEGRSIVLSEIRGRVDDCRIDGVGNLIAHRKGTGASSLRVLLAAHMDEVGLMITLAEDSGLLRFAKVGGIDDRVLPARTVLIGPKKVPGVIGMKPVHLTDNAERNKVVESRQLVIDIGASSKAEAEKLVQRGDTAVFATRYRSLAGEGSAWRTVQGKAFDDRVGCTLLVELLAERFPFALSAAFTVQEEVGLRGAKVVAYAENPDAAVVLECTGANEVPTPLDVSPSTRVGGGAAITIRDTSFIADPRLVELFASTAHRLGIAHQFKQPNIGGTDAGVIHKSRAGIPSITIAVPARYIHSPAAIMDLRDFDATLALVREALQSLPQALSSQGART